MSTLSPVVDQQAIEYKCRYLHTITLCTMATTPFPWEELGVEETARVQAAFPVSAVNDLVRYEHGLLMPRAFTGLHEHLYNFTLRDDDIWIVTYPKVGTTWTQEMVWMLVNDVDLEAGATPHLLRSPFLEAGID